MINESDGVVKDSQEIDAEHPCCSGYGDCVENKVIDGNIPYAEQPCLRKCRKMDGINALRFNFCLEHGWPEKINKNSDSADSVQYRLWIEKIGMSSRLCVGDSVIAVIDIAREVIKQETSAEKYRDEFKKIYGKLRE